MGPQHPSTHGVLRLMLELDGEFVLRTKPVIGYLHTGMEKTAEELTYVQGATNVTRMDYLSPLINELGFSMAVEALLGVEVPGPGRVDPHAHERAQPDQLAPRVDGDQRDGRRLDVDDDLRPPRARDDPRLLREDDRAADEPQLRPPRWRRRRPARRLGGRRRRSSATRSTRAPTSTTSCSPASRSSTSAWRASAASTAEEALALERDRAAAALDGRAVGPAARHALPALRRGGLRRDRRDLRRQLRPLRDPPQRDPRVHPDHPPGRCA